MFAEQEAVADACANELLVKATVAMAAMASDLKMFFILVRFYLFEFVFRCLICRVYIQRRARIVIN